MPDPVRQDIMNLVNKKHSGLLRWPAMMMPMYLEEMQLQFGQNTPVEQMKSSGNAISTTEKIIAEEES